MLIKNMPGWRNGRRNGLKIRYPLGCGGSSPPPGTIYLASDSTKNAVWGFFVNYLLIPLDSPC